MPFGNEIKFFFFYYKFVSLSSFCLHLFFNSQKENLQALFDIHDQFGVRLCTIEQFV